MLIGSYGKVWLASPISETVLVLKVRMAFPTQYPIILNCPKLIPFLAKDIRVIFFLIRVGAKAISTIGIIFGGE
jgi:hypothetical protein